MEAASPAGALSSGWVEALGADVSPPPEVSAGAVVAPVVSDAPPLPQALAIRASKPMIAMNFIPRMLRFLSPFRLAFCDDMQPLDEPPVPLLRLEGPQGVTKGGEGMQAFHSQLAGVSTR